MEGRAVANEDPGSERPPDDDSRPARPRPAADGRRASAAVRGRASSATTRGEAAERRSVPAELEALRCALVEPELVVPWLDGAFFADPVSGEAFDLLVLHGDVRQAADAVEQQPDETGVSGRAIALLHRLAVETPVTEAEDAVALLVGNATARVIAEMSGAHRQATAEDIGNIRQLKLLAESLHEPQTRAGALNQLVPWLAAWSRQQKSETPPPTT